MSLHTNTQTELVSGNTSKQVNIKENTQTLTPTQGWDKIQIF